MEKIKFSITINATAKKVWEVLWNDETYAQWTAAFGEGSHVETDWKQGSRVLFLAGNNDGMVSEIVAITPGQYVSFQHHAAYKNGEVVADAPEMQGWVGTHENYTLQENGQQTLLSLEQEVPADHRDVFNEFWENAFKKIKELAEN
jgi:uncharacterized protein YndB with AHSA1/START domain